MNDIVDSIASLDPYLWAATWLTLLIAPWVALLVQGLRAERSREGAYADGIRKGYDMAMGEVERLANLDRQRLTEVGASERW